jgi:hypothetical protein
MATWRPELHTIDAIVSYYDEYDHPAYRVYAGNSPKLEYCRFQYDGNDKGIGREKLMEALNSLVQNIENTNTYIIQILKLKGKTLEPFNQISFQLNKPNNIYPMQMGSMQYQQNNHINNEILSRLRGLEEKLQTIEEEDDEDEDEDDNNNILSGLLNSPQMKNILINMLANVMQPNKPQAVAGIKENTSIDNEDVKINTAIEILKIHTPELGDKLLKLADMASTNPSQYQWLIKML